MTFDLMKYFREMTTEVNCRISAAEIFDNDPVVIQYYERALIDRHLNGWHSSLIPFWWQAWTACYEFWRWSSMEERREQMSLLWSDLVATRQHWWPENWMWIVWILNQRIHIVLFRLRRVKVGFRSSEDTDFWIIRWIRMLFRRNWRIMQRRVWRILVRWFDWHEDDRRWLRELPIGVGRVVWDFRWFAKLSAQYWPILI